MEEGAPEALGEEREDIFAEARTKADRFFIHEEQWYVEGPAIGPQPVPVLPGFELLAFHWKTREWSRAVVDDFTSRSIRVRFSGDNTRFVFGEDPPLRVLRTGFDAPVDTTAVPVEPPQSVPLQDRHDGGQEVPLAVAEAQVMARMLVDLSELPRESRNKVLRAVESVLATL